MQSHKKYSTWIVLFSLLPIFLTACSLSNKNTTAEVHRLPDSKQIFRYPIGASDFGTLDPALVQNQSDAYAIQAIFTGLVQLKDNGTVGDQLAESHQISPDGLSYTFHLFPNLKFSDGTPLTSKDVAYSINRVLLPATGSPVASYLSLIKDYDQITTGKISTIIGDSLITPNATTIAVILSKPAAYFLQALSYPTSYIVEQKLIEKYGNKWTDHLNVGGGDGPFKVASYSHTKGLELIPNAFYYGHQPQLKKFDLLISGDIEATYKAYLNGQFDIEPAVPPADIATAIQRSDYKTYPTLVIRYLSMNYLIKPFDNIKIRQAFALALDKDHLIKTILRNAVFPTNHIVPSGMVGYNASLTNSVGNTSTKSDENKAIQMLHEGLKEAGYPSVAALPSITFSYYAGSPAITGLVKGIIQQWHTILGITVKTAVFPFPDFIKLLTKTVGHAGPLQLWIAGWQTDYPDPQDVLSICFGKGAAYNSSNYGQNDSESAPNQQNIQQRLLQADIDQDKVTRLHAYREAEQQIIDDVAWIPIYQSEAHTLLNPKLQNYNLNSLFITAPDDWANIYYAG